MTNIVKKYLYRKIHKLNTLIGSSDSSYPQAQNKHIVKNRLLQNNYWWLLPLLNYAYKASVFLEINPVALYFFHLNSFLWKCPLTVKVQIIDHRSDFGLHQILF